MLLSDETDSANKPSFKCLVCAWIPCVSFRALTPEQPCGPEQILVTRHAISAWKACNELKNVSTAVRICANPILLSAHTTWCTDYFQGNPRDLFKGTVLYPPRQATWTATGRGSCDLDQLIVGLLRSWLNTVQGAFDYSIHRYRLLWGLSVLGFFMLQLRKSKRFRVH